MYIMGLLLLPISFSFVNIGIKHVFSSLKVFAMFQGRRVGALKTKGKTNKAKLKKTPVLSLYHNMLSKSKQWYGSFYEHTLDIIWIVVKKDKKWYSRSTIA